MPDSSPTPVAAPTCIVLLLAGGQGMRAGGTMPKQFVPIAGRSAVQRCLDAFSAHPRISAIQLVLPHADDAPALAAAFPKLRDMVALGGATRQQSVQNGLAALAADSDAAWILVHDAARPIVPATVIDRLLDMSADAALAGAVPALPVVDTLAAKETAARDGGDRLGPVADRSSLVRIQTPQAFRLGALRRAHREWRGPDASDDAQMVRALGLSVALVEGDAALAKLTYQEDFAMMEALLGARPSAGTRVAIGMGYDVHRLAKGETLWLGGIRIPHDRGLAGHSDADVALHALTDAILGALALGDIGQHFPPSDPQWRGASSDHFLQHAAALVRAEGGTISHVDLTIICEAPKIGPHRNAMQARIADLLQLRAKQVSVKATTTERLGFAGREEGIAAQAIATLLLKE